MNESNNLSERELEILRLVATGASNKEIARKLVISTNTVKVHLRNIFSKIGVASRTEAAMYTVKIGLVDTSSEAVSSLETEDEEKFLDWERELLPISQQLPPAKYPNQRRMIWTVLGIIVLIVLIIFSIDRVRQESEQTASLGSAVGQNPVIDKPRWQTKASLPGARWGLAAVTEKGEICAIGGETVQGVVSTNECYNPESDTWETRMPKPTPVTDIHAALIGGKIYIPGGRLSGGGVTSILEIYDPQDNQWTKGTSMPTALSAYAMIGFEGKLYVFGGWDGRGYVDLVYEYDPTDDAWIKRTPMPTARGFGGAAVADGKIYVMGGTNGKAALTVNEIYQPSLDGTENPWNKGAHLPNGRYAMGVASVAEIIYVVGGEDGLQSEIPTLIYYAQRDEWQQLEAMLTPQPRSKISLAYLDQHIYAIGGLVAGKPSDLNQIYQAFYTISIPVIRK